MGLSLGIGLAGAQFVGGPVVFTDWAVSGPQSAGLLPYTATISRSALVALAYVAAGGSAPSASQIRAGSGGSIVAAQTVSFTTIGSIDPPDGLNGSYDIYAVLVDGAADVRSDLAITIDTVAATLSSPGSSAVTDTTATVSVTVNSPPTGTLFAGVWPTASTPTAAEIIAGTGAVWTGSTSSPIAGANSFSVTGLTVDVAYKAHFAHRDQQLNVSAVSTSAQFTTAEPVAAPTLVSVNFFDNNDGTPAGLSLTYTGSVTGFRVYIATGTNPITVSAAQLYAGAGGTNTLEFADFAVGSNIDVTGLTSTSNSATRIAVRLILESDGSSASNEVIATVSGLDFTDPAFASATTNIAGTQVIVTASENLTGSTLTDPWTVKINGTAVLIDSVAIASDDVTLTLTDGTTVAFGDTVLVSYSATTGDLRDLDSNDLPSFTDQAVTNAVPNPATIGDLLGTYHQSVDIVSTGTTSETTSSVFPAAGTYVMALAANNGSGLTVTGSAITSAVLLDARVSNAYTALYLVTTSGASDLTLTNGSTTTSFQRLIVVMDGSGLTSTGHIEADASSTNLGSTSAGPTASVPDGWHVFGVAMNRSGTATGAVWSGDFASGDEVMDATFTENTANRATVAYFTKSGAGTVSGTVTWTADDGTNTATLVIVAMEAP